ncbi:MAG: hypothetical protein WC736_15425 [Gallionella sp.]|jgi:hypothetical protein
MADKSIEKGVQNVLANLHIDTGFKTAMQNQDQDNKDFDAAIDLIECERTEGDYDWQSDLFLPEYPAIYLTQMSLDASQLFMTRDYADVYLEDGAPDSVKKSAAAKECINRTLNARHTHHFQKAMRAQAIRRLGRNVVLRCWWDRRDSPFITGFEKKTEIEHDEFGNLQPVEKFYPVEEDLPVIDRFNYDVIDPRNVTTTPEYTYTLQEKRAVYVRFEKTLSELQGEAETHGYINLDELEKLTPPNETQAQASAKRSDAETAEADVSNQPNKPYDIVAVYTKDWVVVTRRDDTTSEPLEAKPGYDNFGKIKEKAELQEVCMAFAQSGTTNVLIQYHLTPYVSVSGEPYRPLIRGICFTHPTRDGGMGEGKMARELQSAINDTFNISNDRVKLATMPVIVTERYGDEDEEYDIYPGANLKVNPGGKIDSLRINSDISGSLNQISMLKNGMQQVFAVYPTTMGNLPSESSTTATAIVGAESRTSARSNFSSLTAEHTLWTELYWMILQMTGKFAHPETGKKLMGDKVYDFDPNADYIYKPITQTIETESSKGNKIKMLQSTLGYIAQIPNPNTPKLINKMLSKMFILLGDEYEDFKGSLLDEQVPIMQPGGNGQATSMEMPMSNQNSVPMTSTEQAVRGARYGGN